jgi:CEL-III C-terminal
MQQMLLARLFCFLFPPILTLLSLSYPLIANNDNAGSPGPISVTGYWEYQYEVTVNMGESNTLSWGTTKTQAETETSQWSASITASVEAGFEIMGCGVKASLSGTVAEQYGQQYQQTWSVSETETFDISFSANQSNKVLWVWQWKFDITDSFGNQLNSASQQYALTTAMELPPQCQPGYNTDEYYQVCVASYYLPGYPLPPSSSTRGRNLRAGSNKN